MMWVEGLAMMVKNFIRPKEPSWASIQPLKRKEWPWIYQQQQKRKLCYP